MLVRIDNGTDPAERIHRCEFCGSVYRCGRCRITQTAHGEFSMTLHPDCQQEYRCPACQRPAIVETLTAEERRALEEL
jgi:hypothetical protein